jgi:hypothetical protein
MSKPATPSSKRIAAFRADIVTAQAEGVDLAELVLRLTRLDASELKRDPTVGLHEIRFAEGEMRFLGVRVEEGGVANSVMDRNNFA